ncbi:hypothetical protein KC19_VG004000 [Ceratodon purpureus]|uniref:Secreted protein n=1 Tax=Ceratodon purpureus TaxID=3225 RepID=A0A8T0HKT3_CERPU|nr:hypothetical protein KC19_VG004000 [Ceratodon purpureus]
MRSEAVLLLLLQRAAFFATSNVAVTSAEWCSGVSRRIERGVEENWATVSSGGASFLSCRAAMRDGKEWPWLCETGKKQTPALPTLPFPVQIVF